MSSLLVVFWYLVCRKYRNTRTHTKPGSGFYLAAIHVGKTVAFLFLSIAIRIESNFFYKFLMTVWHHFGQSIPLKIQCFNLRTLFTHLKT